MAPSSPPTDTPLSALCLSLCFGPSLLLLLLDKPVPFYQIGFSDVPDGLML